MKTRVLLLSILIVQAILLNACKKSESSPPAISIQDTISVAEGTLTPITVSIPVTLSSSSAVQVSLKWSTSDGSAKAGSDYVGVKDSLLVFEPGETSKNIVVQIVNDAIYEPDKTFYVTLTDVKNADILKYQTTVTIKNDDPYIPVINTPSVFKITEGTTANVIAKIPIILNFAYDKAISLKWKTTEGSARAYEDYTPVTAGTLTFAPGETQKTLDLEIVSDNILEFNDSLFVDISDVNDAIVGNGHTKVIIMNDDGYTPIVAADGPITPDNYPGMKLVWADEFDGSSLNLDNWTYELGGGGWGNSELETYTNTPINSFVSDGKLSIVATKNYSNYNSARIITKGKKEFKYGRIDIRAKLPKGQGIWPALWMLGSNIDQMGWPACGELDIMELIGNQPGTVYGTAHYYSGGHQSKGGSYSLTGSQIYNDQFHVFSVLWQENSIIWYVDYQKYCEVTNANIAFAAFLKSQFFIFNVAIGGTWPGNPDGTTVFPQTMQVDYIRLFMPS